MEKDNGRLSLVVPVFNEEPSIDPFLKEVEEVILSRIDMEVEVIFINDGSTDSTLDKLTSARAKDKRVKIIDLSRNFGKEAALTAGLFYSSGEAVVPVDVDLQDPLELIHEMIGLWREGYEVVLAKREDRTSDSWAKRFTAKYFYKIYNKLAKVKLPENVGDFRLMDKTVVDALRKLPESCRFMKGIFSWAGFRATTIEYKRIAREKGRSKFNAIKLLGLALEGITSFSDSLLKIWSSVGFLIALFSFIYGAVIVGRVVFYGVDVPGYASTIVIVSFLGGVQLMGIGVLGEYLARTYIEAKRRPIYLIRKVYE